MKTIVLRFGESFSPDCGTIAAHQKIIDNLGYVWYGKLGVALSTQIIEDLLRYDDPKFLLINSRKNDFYWVHFNTISKERPYYKEYPSYYGNKIVRMNTWFKVTAFEETSKYVASYCTIISSGSPLNVASKRSMNPYFIIEYKEDV